MPPSKVYPLRTQPENRSRWQQAAEQHSISFNAWAVRALNEQAALDEALRRQEQADDE